MRRSWPSGRGSGRKASELIREKFAVNPPALIASDVDGTLLDADELVTARTRAAVRAAIAGGATFVLATGRPPRWMDVRSTSRASVPARSAAAASPRSSVRWV